jgi:hypothetical protein
MCVKTKQKKHGAVGIMTLCVLAAVYLGIPSWMGLQTKYNAIFFGALKDTDTASCERYLSELGLPIEFVRYRNTNIYVEGIALELEENGYDRDIMAVSNLDIASFYLKHPGRLFHALSVSLMNAESIRPFYLSNYSNEAPKLTFSHRFSLWGDTRVLLGFDTWPGFCGVILVFGLTVCIIMKSSGRKWYEALAVLFLSGGILAYFFIVPFMSNGEGDLAKHLFAFAQLTDMMVLFVIAAVLHGISMKKARLIPAGCLIMVLCLAFAPVKSQITHLIRLNTDYSSPESGAYILYGTYEGKSLVWQVIETEGGFMTLLSADAVTVTPFSVNGSSGWETSDLRQWLNTAFLSAFSGVEQSHLQPINNTVLLSFETKRSAASGDRDFYFSPVPSLASRGYAEAYQAVTLDLVTLPDIDVISGISADGGNIALNEAYWLETPYFNNGYMVRCVMPDSRILMREAAEQSGVRPVIQITAGDAVSGSGTFSDPFVLN